MKARIKMYNGKINTNFQGNKIPEEGGFSVCFSMILLNSVLRLGKNIIRKHF